MQIKMPSVVSAHRPRAGLHADQGGAEVAGSIPQKAAPVKSRRGPRLLFSACRILEERPSGLRGDDVYFRDAAAASMQVGAWREAQGPKSEHDGG